MVFLDSIRQNHMKALNSKGTDLFQQFLRNSLFFYFYFSISQAFMRVELHIIRGEVLQVTILLPSLIISFHLVNKFRAVL
jgi:hypothetical protein